LAFKPNEKFSTTHYAEENSTANQTQMVVGKGIPNLLIVEDLLKNLRDLILLPLQNLLQILVHGMVRS